MKKYHKCFCGSGKNIKQCHPGIISNSRFAKLHKLYKKVDDEIKAKVEDNKLDIICCKGCSECCHQLFNVPELEFCLIVDFIETNFNRKEKDDLIARGQKIYSYFEENYSNYLKRLNFNGSGMKIEEALMRGLTVNPDVAPMECVFLNENKTCSIYSIRPLICRTHGVAYLNDEPNVICSKLNISESNRDKFVDLRHFEKEYTELLMFKDKRNNRAAIRRGFPLFYWINYLRENNMSFSKLKETVFYARYTLMNEEEAVASVFQKLNQY